MHAKTLVSVLGVASVAIACARFGSDTSAPDAGAGGDGSAGGDGAAVCDAEACPDATPSCRAYTFAAASCLPDWELQTGDRPNVTGDCNGGKLHVAAANTLDIVAQVALPTPASPYSVHVSGRIAVTKWDGGRVLSLDVGPSAIELRAWMNAAGNALFTLCLAKQCSAAFEAAPGVEHLFAFDVGTAGTTATVDCNTWAQLPGVVPATSDTFVLSFGRPDGNPIDGTLDDVMILFRDAP